MRCEDLLRLRNKYRRYALVELRGSVESLSTEDLVELLQQRFKIIAVAKVKNGKCEVHGDAAQLSQLLQSEAVSIAEIYCPTRPCTTYILFYL